MMRALGSGIEIFLHPGEWYFGDRHTRIRTLLGSCVAITLWHPREKIGGMCHYMLPGRDDPRAALNARYGCDALQLMLLEVRRHGGNASEYEVKLFGGGNMFGLSPDEKGVACRNIIAARTLMQRYGLPVVAESLGGCRYRQLIFNLADGDVWVRMGPGHLTAADTSGVA
ncbi:MAG: chemotaxis protein CheD [Oleiphilaceae bacterium]|nr:chemotaxis protein CheD [Oleiphilaceae bacterium]